MTFALVAELGREILQIFTAKVLAFESGVEYKNRGANGFPQTRLTPSFSRGLSTREVQAGL